MLCEGPEKAFGAMFCCEAADDIRSCLLCASCVFVYGTCGAGSCLSVIPACIPPCFAPTVKPARSFLLNVPTLLLSFFCFAYIMSPSPSYTLRHHRTS